MSDSTSRWKEIREWSSFAIASCAFLLSSILTVQSWLGQADPVLVPPREIDLVYPAGCLHARQDIDEKDIQSDENDYVQLHAQMSYVNRGDLGRNAVIIAEDVTFDIGNACEYEFRGYEFVEIVNRKKPELAEMGTIFQAFVVNAGGATSHPTLFVPFDRLGYRQTKDCRKKFNFLPRREFFSRIKNRKYVEFKLSARRYDEGALEEVCRVRVKDIKNLKYHEKVCAVRFPCMDSI